MKTISIFASLTFLLAACSKQEPATTETTAAEVAAKPYPLDVCIVSGEELGGMGEPVVIVHEGQEIKFCCDKCEPKFRKDPDKYLSKLEQP